LHWAERAARLARLRAGKRSAARIPITAITDSSSINVNPLALQRTGSTLRPDVSGKLLIRSWKSKWCQSVVCNESLNSTGQSGLHLKSASMNSRGRSESSKSCLMRLRSRHQLPSRQATGDAPLVPFARDTLRLPRSLQRSLSLLTNSLDKPYRRRTQPLDIIGTLATLKLNSVKSINIELHLFLALAVY
jgi:hypothetical protein